MAQIKRKKISNKATKGQGTGGLKGLIRNKKFWAIASLFVVAVCAAIILIVIFTSNSSSSDSENKVQDYFGGESTNLSYVCEDTGKEVTFTKMSYAGVLMHTNVAEGADNTFVNHVFVFATDLSTFYADKAIDDGKDKDDGDILYPKDERYTIVFNQLVKLQGNIDKYNEEHKDVEGSSVALYIVDTSISDNVAILADSNFGGADDSSNTSIFALVEADKHIANYVNENGKTVDIFSSSITNIATTSINMALNFMLKQDFVSNE